ncbi:MAG TPA: hypothetical protein VF765_22685 [Polyangiaceae bacterium]
MRKVAAALALAVLASAPLPERVARAEDPAPEPPRTHGETGLDGFRADGDARPEALAAPIRFDPDALPVATWGEPRATAGFALHARGNGFRLWLRSRLFAEVVVENTRGGTEFSAFTGGSFFEGAPPDCGPGHTGSFPARWAGLAPRHWTDAGVDVEMGDGDFDLASCDARPRVSVQARAAAIVPGFVYGLRVRRADDDEMLFVFLPRGVLVSAAGDASAPIALSNTGPFTRLSMPLERGGARSAAVRVSPASLRLWSHIRTTIAPVWAQEDATAPHDALLVSVDAAWQDDRKLGSIALALPRRHDKRPYAALVAAAQAVTN